MSQGAATGGVNRGVVNDFKAYLKALEQAESPNSAARLDGMSKKVVGAGTPNAETRDALLALAQETRPNLGEEAKARLDRDIFEKLSNFEGATGVNTAAATERFVEEGGERNERLASHDAADGPRRLRAQAEAELEKNGKGAPAGPQLGFGPALLGGALKGLNLEQIRELRNQMQEDGELPPKLAQAFRENARAFEERTGEEVSLDVAKELELLKNSSTGKYVLEAYLNAAQAKKAGRSPRPIDAALIAFAENQTGDPAKAAQAIFDQVRPGARTNVEKSFEKKLSAYFDATKNVRSAIEELQNGGAENLSDADLSATLTRGKFDSKPSPEQATILNYLSANAEGSTKAAPHFRALYSGANCEVPEKVEATIRETVEGMQLERIDPESIISSVRGVLSDDVDLSSYFGDKTNTVRKLFANDQLLEDARLKASDPNNPGLIQREKARNRIANYAADELSESELHAQLLNAKKWVDQSGAASGVRSRFGGLAEALGGARKYEFTQEEEEKLSGAPDIRKAMEGHHQAQKRADTTIRRSANRIRSLLRSGLPIELLIQYVMGALTEQEEEKFKLKMEEVAVIEQFEKHNEGIKTMRAKAEQAQQALDNPSERTPSMGRDEIDKHLSAKELSPSDFGFSQKSTAMLMQDVQVSQQMYSQTMQAYSNVIRLNQDIGNHIKQNIRS